MRPSDIDTSFLLEQISQNSTLFEKDLDSLIKKQTGSYYTAMELTLAMMQELVDTLDKNKITDKTFFEPCVGTGNFVFAYLKICSNLNLTREEYRKIIYNIYVCDINQEALSIYRNNLFRLAHEWFGIFLDDNYFDTHIGSGLLFNLNDDQICYYSLSDIFGSEIANKGFDIVVTNPPYKNLKAEKGQYKDSLIFEKDKAKYEQIAKIANAYLKYSTTGTLNIYKMFVEEILEKYLSPNGVASLLIPSSILSDKTCSKLRSRILDTCDIRSIRLIAENSKYVTASQALCAVLFHKGTPTKQIQIDGDFAGDIQKGFIVSTDDILDKNTENAILILSSSEYHIRQQMLAHPTIRELSYIMNLRGELDLTLNSKSIAEHATLYKLYRGRNIGFYKLIDAECPEYVSEDFVNSTAKKKYIFRSRLVCQQVVNMSKKKRISFTIAPENCVLGNSCNFISIESNEDDVDMYFLLGILNSSLIEWFFKLSSSNNHINNYEIDNFPIPVNYKKKNKIRNLVKTYLTSFDESILSDINSLVYEAYGIVKEPEMNNVIQDEPTSNSCSIFHDKTRLLYMFCNDLNSMMPNVSVQECSDILDGKLSVVELSFMKNACATKFEKSVLDCIEQKYKKIYSKEVLNHTTFKLSDLDLEMIAPVPQGGSWKDIPLETVQKSKRLMRITKTGGRTTLYGRIDYSKPSYTITTYFNRPGNGTYVHPIHQRVLSVREAARLQSFTDDYIFYGNKSDMLKQVGNAVPVLLAYNIGRAIKEKTGCSTSVDLFSGAGGMTYGFKLAGINAVIANDIVENACVTLKSNCPEIPVLCGDITDETVKREMIQRGKTHHADIICGGPPCQGFSLAGFRREDDPRNQLFRHFVDIVSGVSPKVIVFENVEGLRSYQNGETYRNIIELFSELGYHAEGRTLMANHYGVPQRRKRVIILCTRKDLNILPSDIYPSHITPNMDKQTTAYETLYDLEDVECSENAKYNSSYSSHMLRYLKHEITCNDYLSLVEDTRDIGTEEDDYNEEPMEDEE